MCAPRAQFLTAKSKIIGTTCTKWCARLDLEPAGSEQTMKRVFGLLLMLVLAATSFAQTAPPVTPDRYKSFLFGIAYYPEQWPESLWERDAQRMRECGVQAVRIGEFAWALMEPKEGTFDFSLFDRAIAVLAKHNLKIIFGTPTATPPKWLTQKYPEVLYVFADRQAANDQSRRHYNYNSPV
jgi:hypothetical protein